MNFAILGIHQPGFVPGVTVLCARVRMFVEGVPEPIDEDFELPDIVGITHTIDSPTTRHMVRPHVEVRMSELRVI